LTDAAEVLKEGEIITIRGGGSNKFFKQILKGTAKGLDKFKIVQSATKISTDVSGTMRTSGRDPVKGEILEVVLQKL